MDARLRPLGNTFLHYCCEDSVVPEVGKWSYGDDYDSSYEITCSDSRSDSQLLYTDSRGGGVLVRGSIWLEGDTRAFRVRLKLSSNGTMLTCFKAVGESEWGEAITASKVPSYPQVGVRKRSHSIPNYIPWQLRMRYDSGADVEAHSQTHKYRMSVGATCESDLAFALGCNDLESAAATAPDVRVMTSAEHYAKRRLARGAGVTERHASKYCTWTGIVGNAGSRRPSKSDEDTAAESVLVEPCHSSRSEAIEAEDERRFSANSEFVPAMSTDQDFDKDDRPDTDMTTLMIRNIPSSITQVDLLRELNADGFQGQYDFCYLPASFNDGSGKGYAFINFRSVVYASRFVLNWHRSRRFKTKPNDAGLNICPAARQGLEANLQKWDIPRINRIRNPNLRPFVLKSDADETQRPSSEAGASRHIQELGPHSQQSQTHMPKESAVQAISLSSHLGSTISKADVKPPMASSNAQVYLLEQNAQMMPLPLPRVPGIQLPPASPSSLPMLLGTSPVEATHRAQFQHFGDISYTVPPQVKTALGSVKYQ